jgi:hypothetical protein
MANHPPEHVASVAWRRLDHPATEYCSLWEAGELGWAVDGVVVGALDGAPYRIVYQIHCAPDWRTERFALRLDRGDRAETLELSRAESVEFAGRLDADLGFSPSTNTLPVRRLGLPVGGSAEIEAAWVRFPELDVLPLRQRYTRLADRTYRYESLDSGFARDLSVDEHGLVVDYAGLWERIGGVGE